MEIKKPVTVKNTVNASIEKVWELWTEPVHIKKWNNASDDWDTPKAENDVRPGGKFLSRMAAKDGSAEFDLTRNYNAVEKPKHIAYTIEDGRKVSVYFSSEGDNTHITETFEPEEIHSMEMQKNGWQAILDSFKRYVEEKSLHKP